MSQPETQQVLHGRFRASRADREQVIEVLKAAFVQGRLTKDELEARAACAFQARTYADLAVVTADIPAAPAVPPRRPPAAKRSGLPMNTAISVGAFIIVAAHLALLAALLSGNSSAVTLVAVLLLVAVIATIGAVIIAD
jgi:hypothetical protein